MNSSRLTARQKRYIRQHYASESVDTLSKTLGVSRSAVQAYIATIPASSYGYRKRVVFSLLLFLIPAGILLLAEGGLRLLNYGGDLRLFISAPPDISEYYRCNPELGQRYFYRQFTIPDPPKDLFLKKKPANGYRIFVLGGSTAAGFPYGNNMMFSRILWRRLQDTFPEKNIEVVNLGMSAVNSYTLLDLMDELPEHDPDLILIYAGHNEFYGALGVASLESLGRNRLVVKAYLHLQHLRLFRLVRDALGQVIDIFHRDPGNGGSDATATLMERIVANQVIPIDSKLYSSGMNQFRENLREILQLAKREEVRVVLSELVSNIGDQPPFQSLESDTAPPAKQVYSRAQTLESRGEYRKALEAYTRAKDLDALRFRATEECNAIIHSLAADFDIPVVPMRKIFQNASDHKIPGDGLFLEHLHPNTDGNFLMAEGFYHTLHSYGFISNRWDSTRIRNTQFYKDSWGATAFDTVYAGLSIRWLKGGWPFQPKERRNTSLDTYHPGNHVDSLALKVLTDKGIGVEMGHLTLARRYEQKGQYRKALREYRALMYTIPHEVLFYEGAVKMLLKLDRPEEAIPILQESLRIKQNNFATTWLPRLYLKQGNVRDALSRLSQAPSDMTSHPGFLNTLAHAYIASDQRQRFMNVLRRLQHTTSGSLEHFPYDNNPDTRKLAQQYNSISTVFLKDQDYGNAYRLLTQSLQLDETAFASKWIGQILLVRKQFRDALPYLKRAEALGLKDADLYYNLAAANYYTDRSSDATHYLRQLKRIRPDHPDPSGLLDKLELH